MEFDKSRCYSALNADELKAGDKVTLHTDGMQVTATTTDGVVTVVDVNGATAAGDEIIVRI